MTSLFSTQAPDTLDHDDRWREHARCATEGHDPEDWFPVGEGAMAQQQADDAKHVCYQCPVITTCLRWALENREDTGVWGGLTEKERRRLHGRKARTPAAAPSGPRTPTSVLASHSQEVDGGHIAWTGVRTVSVNGVEYTPKRLAWHVAHNAPAQGQIVADCEYRGCINPEHLLDDAGRRNRHGTPKAAAAHLKRGETPCEECQAARREARRTQPRRKQAECGTRSGYAKHLRQGEETCAPCRQANADSDRRLRNTGTTKQLTEESRLPNGVARCGTADGYKAHRRWGEKACQPCLDAHRAAERAAADAPSLPTCGTRSGYDIHTTRGEAPCRPCTDARARTEWLLRPSAA